MGKSSSLETVVNYASDVASLLAMKQDCDWLAANRPDSSDLPELRKKISQLKESVIDIEVPARGVSEEIHKRAAQLGLRAPVIVDRVVSDIIDNKPDVSALITSAKSLPEAVVNVAKGIVLPALLRAGRFSDMLNLKTGAQNAMENIQEVECRPAYRRKYGV